MAAIVGPGAMDRADARVQFTVLCCNRRTASARPATSLAAFPATFRPIGASPYPGGVTEPQRPHRPVRRADLASLDGAVSDVEPFARTELAHATAAAVLSQGRENADNSFVDLADRVGLDTLAELWRDEQPSSLPGALWALYLLRRWCNGNGEEVTRLWRAGRGFAPADEVVAGVSDNADPAAVSALADSVLSGAYSGDFDVALERAAAFFRVVAAGRRESAPPGSEGERELQLAERNSDVADGLALAAARWRAQPL
ncbi:MAG: hypothetical protein QOH56_2075 [Pseudonocardiales bacterium]|jgi:hypothetical protein|nr:hypothetical protein [Pseudonocardiales bacterium]